ncbi:MAG: hypothetical protein JXX14_11220 [Deltaproteobacteria bacterium]|nr:hypothetical protein [Deltaproteobacteria bacterium]
MAFRVNMVLTVMIMAAALGCSDDSTSATSDTALSNNNDISSVVDSSGDSPDGTSGDVEKSDGTTDDASVVQFPGSGTSGSGGSLEPGIPPETSAECNANTASASSDVKEVISKEVECFYGEDRPDIPAASMEQIVEVVADKEWVHLRLTLDPSFVDNSYGQTAVGWEDSKKGTHTFKDLVGSDHAEMLLYDADDNLALHFKVDYISEDETQVSGYSTLGVEGGDGKMIVGDAASVLGVATSLNRNINGCGLQYVEDSPQTNTQYVLPAGAEAWDFRVVYEVWVEISVFGEAGFGKAIIENVHASPSKQESNTIEVIPGDCPKCDPAVEDCDPIPVDTDPGDTATVDTDTPQDSDPPGTDNSPEVE